VDRRPPRGPRRRGPERPGPRKSAMARFRSEATSLARLIAAKLCSGPPLPGDVEVDHRAEQVAIGGVERHPGRRGCPRAVGAWRPPKAFIAAIRFVAGDEVGLEGGGYPAGGCGSAGRGHGGWLQRRNQVGRRPRQILSHAPQPFLKLEGRPPSHNGEPARVGEVPRQDSPGMRPGEIGAMAITRRRARRSICGLGAEDMALPAVDGRENSVARPMSRVAGISTTVMLVSRFGRAGQPRRQERLIAMGFATVIRNRPTSESSIIDARKRGPRPIAGVATDEEGPRATTSCAGRSIRRAREPPHGSLGGRGGGVGTFAAGRRRRAAARPRCAARLAPPSPVEPLPADHEPAGRVHDQRVRRFAPARPRPEEVVMALETCRDFYGLLRVCRNNLSLKLAIRPPRRTTVMRLVFSLKRPSAR